MPEVQQMTETYFADFAGLANGVARKSAWFEPRRKEAMEHFAGLGFPTTRQEDWRFTNVSPLARTPFKAAEPGRNGVTPQKLGHVLLPDVAARLAFVDGFF